MCLISCASSPCVWSLVLSPCASSPRFSSLFPRHTSCNLVPRHHVPGLLCSSPSVWSLVLLTATLRLVTHVAASGSLHARLVSSVSTLVTCVARLLSQHSSPVSLVSSVSTLVTCVSRLLCLTLISRVSVRVPCRLCLCLDPPCLSACALLN